MDLQKSTETFMTVSHRLCHTLRKLGANLGRLLKFENSSRFQGGSLCEELDTALSRAIDLNYDTTEIKVKSQGI